ncbi:hypothetical protein OAG71_00445 [bacterium]|nr:hypothetical protein [bacterium]
MKLSQFSISALIALTTLVAITLVASRPFVPHLQFKAVATNSINPRQPEVVLGYDMSVTNMGKSSIWIASSSGTAFDCVCTTAYRKGGRGKYSINVYELEKQGVNVQWIRVRQNESVKIPMGGFSTIYSQFFGLPVRDWRGREVKTWSESFKPPSL